MQHRLLACGLRIVFGLLVFAVLATAILSRPAKWLGDFDQSFYLTIAYDLNHHGVFSNGVFDKVNSTVAIPPPGIFFGPIYPWIIVAATGPSMSKHIFLGPGSWRSMTSRCRIDRARD
jgi:hypothetical protein